MALVRDAALHSLVGAQAIGRSGGANGRESRVCLVPTARIDSSSNRGNAKRPTRVGAQVGRSPGDSKVAVVARTRTPSYPLVMSGRGSILRSGLAWSVATFARWRATRWARTGGSRMADTRVTRVPAVATRLSLDLSSRLRRVAIMAPWETDAWVAKSRAADAAPSGLHSPFRRTAHCAITAGLHRDATPCTKHSELATRVNEVRARACCSARRRHTSDRGEPARTPVHAGASLAGKLSSDASSTLSSGGESYPEVPRVAGRRRALSSRSWPDAARPDAASGDV